MKFWSLRRSLVIGINLAVIAVLVFTAWASYRDILHELDEVFDAQLAQTAKSLAAFYTHSSETQSVPKRIPISNYNDTGEDESANERGPSGHKYESKIGYHIYNSEGKLLALTNQLKILPLKNLDAGYHTLENDAQTWFIFSYFSKSKGIWVRTFQREDVRSELSGYLATEQLYPLVLMWVPISLIILFIVYLVLKPVNRFAIHLRARALNNLSPIESELPKELIPIKQAINKLLHQIKMFSEREKRFIADASHELRTPLSAIQVHAENIIHAESLEDSKQSGKAIFSTVERMSHLVNQLLRLNRLDSLDKSTDFSEIELKTLVSAAINALPTNTVENYQWQIDAPTIKIACNETLIISALTNLLSNAMKFSPADSKIQINAVETSESITIKIMDQGTGVPTEMLQRMGERLYRFQGHSGIDGSGLGLSITSKIIQLHDGKISFNNIHPTGFAVQIELPKSTVLEAKLNS
ncbi:signal transduction histidine kinase [Idiomarina loihiensis]|uniref:ATP-binding protein n=1 Tax=Idiomarina TaxID=135575 RepID=UPI000D715F6D|nr:MULTISPECIES: ATP-binding protein [Idiomarina]PWW36307.1 signal transduction histidine kinase [Idiomarina loihiensis]TDP46635.1 signal transduction histidine kinase [Idiomarina loihiensis]TDS22757.1 signal transduction histidine kinase [Idiomarina sp. H2]